MKHPTFANRLLTFTLCFSILFTTVGVLDNPRPAEAQVAAGVLIIACVAIASCIIIKVMRQPPDVVDRVLVLDRDHYDGNWTPVVTNFHAILYADHPVSMFADVIPEDSTGSRYRVRDITDDWRKQHPLFSDQMAMDEIQIGLSNCIALPHELQY